MHERNITTQYSPDLEALTRKKRVCAYARVSSDRDEAFHSLSTQISYYQKTIAEHGDWEYAGVFSDRGITGTKEERPGFQAMLEACREGKIDIVLAKSITRFARNTVVLLSTVRELRSLGIDIYFEEERIHTLSAQGELMISLLAARAQEESRSASENQKWRIQKCYEQGIPVTGNCLGYRMVDHQFLIDEEEEQIVLRIFSMYLSGMGISAIAKELTLEGAKNRFGQVKWSSNGIREIIRNEKYIGNLRLQKKYVSDHITKKQVKNRGEKPIFEVTDAHDAIIDQKVFADVQKEIEQRASRKKPNKGIKRPFSGMITCGKCNRGYSFKYRGAAKKYKKAIWSCNTTEKYGKHFCDAQAIPDEVITEKASEILGIGKLDERTLRERISKIIVPKHHTIVFVFNDGTEKATTWAYRSRRESWTPEMKDKARKDALKRWGKQEEG